MAYAVTMYVKSNQMKTLISLAAAALLLYGCASTDSSNSDNVKQTEVWQNYWVEYNEAGDELTSGCTFRFGGSTGTTLELTRPANVVFQGKELTSSTGVLIEGVIGGTHYSYSGKGFKPEYTFKYTNNDGKTFTNSIGVTKCVVDDVPELLDAGKTNTFAFKLPPVAPGEHLRVEVTNSQNNWVYIDEPLIDGTSVTIKGSELAELGNGTVNVRFQKTKSNALTEAEHLGGNIGITYNTKQYQAKLVNANKPNIDNIDTVQTIKQQER
jgi:hypothetical protein